MSLLSFKRELNRSQYWLSILGVILLFCAAYYVALPVFSMESQALPEWRKYLSIVLAISAMLFWMSTLASRYYMLQHSRFKGAFAALFPFVNILATLGAGVMGATRPGSEERPLPPYVYTILAVMIIVGGVYLFATADTFEDARTFIKQVLSAIVVLAVIGFFMKSSSSSSSRSKSTSSSSSSSSNKSGGLFSSNKPSASTQPSQKREIKEVGFYMVNEGGYRDQKIRVYSDGQSFTAKSNRKEIKADSFRALEPLIYQTFKGDKKFQMIDSREF